MAEYIDSVCRSCFHSYVCEQFNEHRDSNNKRCHFFNDHFAPVADVVPVRHGRLIETGYVCGETEYQCSECKETEWRTSASRMKYCPFCGAKMDGGAD